MNHVSRAPPTMTPMAARTTAHTAPTLVFGIGNPSRGDDALGPLFVERAAASLAAEVGTGQLEFLTDFQLQIEHVLDLVGRRRVCFVDASVGCAPPFEFSPVSPCSGAAPFSHVMEPATLLDVYRATQGQAPQAWVLAIRGERFELGATLSESAHAHLDAALAFFVPWVCEHTSVSRRIELEGTVQGVGLRPWVCRVARHLGVAGSVRNTPRGLRIDVRGPRRVLDELLTTLQRDPSYGPRIRAVHVTPHDPASISGEGGFTIATSDTGQEEGLCIPPDLASCEDCLREVTSPTERRHGYPFTTCAVCGPRFAIAHAGPYDRERTTLQGFVPCAACRREYDTPADRRFHAQTIACAACGPRAWLTDVRGVELSCADPIAEAAERIRAGAVLAVQGIGAFHLVCDASDPHAVAALRRRKHRDAQPFAVMVVDEAAAEALAHLDDAARAVLRSTARPIVLAPSRPGALPSVVNGPSPCTGLLLPYTPLHHLLALRVGRPLVVTSGNVHGGPPALTHEEARASLGAVVDAFLVHDRPIAHRVEDSVVDARGLRVLRRARGLAPTPLRLPMAAREPIVAVGGQQKNTACVVVDDLAYLTPHLGDLGFVESERAWVRELERFEALLGVRPRVIAHDLHPEYFTTRYALSRDASRLVGVQHHAAHAWAVVAEHHLTEPAIAVVFDGTGWGLDGTSWGGEFLWVDGAGWQRVASFRPIALPGGEGAIREVWRPALAALVDAFGPEEALALSRRFGAFDDVPERARATVVRMIETALETPRARGLGRYFDALGAFTLGCSRARFEAHVAIALEACADDSEHRVYPVVLPECLALDGDVSSAHEIDLRPTVRAVVDDLLAGTPASVVAARFHQTVVEATVDTVERIAQSTGIRRVVLSGGCMQNHRIREGITRRFGEARTAIGKEVPVNDGGLALGQAWAAVLSLERKEVRGECVSAFQGR